MLEVLITFRGKWPPSMKVKCVQRIELTGDAVLIHASDGDAVSATYRVELYAVARLEIGGLTCG